MEHLPEEDSESYDNMLEIYNASRKAKEIISRLSDLSRKNPSSAFQDISPDALVQRALTVTAPARPKQVEVETHLDCAQAVLRCNELQISQMLLNLILNAFQAMEAAGGLLTISTAGLPVALSKMVSEANTLGRKNQIQRAFHPAFVIAFGVDVDQHMAAIMQLTGDHLLRDAVHDLTLDEPLQRTRAEHIVVTFLQKFIHCFVGNVQRNVSVFKPFGKSFYNFTADFACFFLAEFSENYNIVKTV